MIQSTSLFSLFLFPLLFISCKTNDYSKNGFNEKSIRSVLSLQEKEWNNGNIEGYMSGYNKSDSLRFASGGNVTFGWENTLLGYKNSYPDKLTMGELHFSKIDIIFVSDEAAVVFGKWELTRNNDNPSGLFTLLFKYISGEWKIVHDHTSSAG